MKLKTRIFELYEGKYRSLAYLIDNLYVMVRLEGNGRLPTGLEG